jgi:hypothetical protein
MHHGRQAAMPFDIVRPAAMSIAMSIVIPLACRSHDATRATRV